MLKTVIVKKFESPNFTKGDEVRMLLVVFISGVVLGLVLGIMMFYK